MSIDAHVHIFSRGQSGRRTALAAADPGFAAIYAGPRAKMADAAALEATLAADGLEGAVAAGFAFARERDIEEQNAALIDASAESNGRVAALATLNLRHPAWRRVAEEALQGGARGFGELRPRDQRWDPLGPAAHALCELAASLALRFSGTCPSRSATRTRARRAAFRPLN